MATVRLFVVAREKALVFLRDIVGCCPHVLSYRWFAEPTAE
jgi:hypothetical protein